MKRHLLLSSLIVAVFIPPGPVAKAATRSATDTVLHAPGLVAFWDFVKREPDVGLLLNNKRSLRGAFPALYKSFRP